MVTKRILWQVKPGSVILLHDTPDTAAALPELIARLKAKGYRFVTVTQMLARLPRPVFLVSNAGHVSPDAEEPIAERPIVTPRRRAVRPKRSEPEPSVRSPFDDPAWDGYKSETSV